MKIFKTYKEMKSDFEYSEKLHAQKHKRMLKEFEKQKLKNKEFQEKVESKIKSIQSR